ncbi:hypothetical protein KC340_g88 [Hortaea werneckii]|nr:hypothetical protein KC340_g88 [Hortaea werneckii]
MVCVEHDIVLREDALTTVVFDMQTLAIASLCTLASAVSRARDDPQSNPTLLQDIDKISTHWGQLSPYRDNDEQFFGVRDVGLPNGCQVEQVHSLQRHAQRFPTSYFDDGLNDERFAAKIANFTVPSWGVIPDR